MGPTLPGPPPRPPPPPEPGGAVGEGPSQAAAAEGLGVQAVAMAAPRAGSGSKGRRVRSASSQSPYKLVWKLHSLERLQSIPSSAAETSGLSIWRLPGVCLRSSPYRCRGLRNGQTCLTPPGSPCLAPPSGNCLSFLEVLWTVGSIHWAAASAGTRVLGSPAHLYVPPAPWLRAPGPGPGAASPQGRG